jgi:hypothetical protein
MVLLSEKLGCPIISPFKNGALQSAAQFIYLEGALTDIF